jgi:hypothetical protein
VITAIDGSATRGVEQVEMAVTRARPGTTLTVTYLHRGLGQPKTTDIHIVADPRFEVIPVEQAGQTLSAAQRAFREAWLRSRAGNTF